MLTSEYAVLRGAKSLALATKLGQFMDVEYGNNNPDFSWMAFDKDKKLWFEACFQAHSLKIINTTDQKVAKKLQKLLTYCIALRPKSFQKLRSIKTHLEFDQNWGYGSSSTLVSNIAKWLEIDGINLLNAAFKGSGYDVAVGMENSSIVYQVINEKPNWSKLVWKPIFRKSLYFVYLNKKQNSESQVIKFLKNSKASPLIIEKLNEITENIINITRLDQFNKLMNEHNKIIAKLIDAEIWYSNLFPNFEGLIKPLGAWGGDFILVTSPINPIKHFNNLGYNTVLPFDEVIS